MSTNEKLEAAATHYALNVGTPSAIKNVRDVITAKTYSFKAGAEWQANEDAAEIARLKAELERERECVDVAKYFAKTYVMNSSAGQSLFRMALECQAQRGKQS